MQDAGEDWRQEKGTTEDAMVGWHHWLDAHEFEQALGVGDGQGSLACCSPWGRTELDTTEWLNWTEDIWMEMGIGFQGKGRKGSIWSSPIYPISFFFKKTFFSLLQVLAAARRIFTVAVGPSLLTRDQTQAPCTGSMESWPLDHQGSSYPTSF